MIALAFDLACGCVAEYSAIIARLWMEVVFLRMPCGPVGPIVAYKSSASCMRHAGMGFFGMHVTYAVVVGVACVLCILLPAGCW